MSWDEMADGWDDDPAVRAYSEAAFDSLRDVLAARQRGLRDARVLDFGCGTGLLTAKMAAEAATVVGLDVAPKMVEVLRAKQLPHVTALVGPLGDHDLAPFDLITCSSVLAFVDDYARVVSELAARLVPGGVLVHWDWELDPGAEEPFGLSREVVRHGLVAAGLERVEVDVGFDIPFGEMRMAPVRGVGERASNG